MDIPQTPQTPSAQPGASAPKSNKTLIIVIVAVVALFALGSIGKFIMGKVAGFAARKAFEAGTGIGIGADLARDRDLLGQPAQIFNQHDPQGDGHGP